VIAVSLMFTIVWD